MTERDTYYIFKPDFPKLEVLRVYILKGEVQLAVNYFTQENLSANAYMKGQRPGAWVPLLYQCFQDKRLSPLIKLLINRGGDPLLPPDAEDFVPLIFLCDDIYLDFLVKKGLTVDPETKVKNLYDCFLYARLTRVRKLLRLNLISRADISAAEQAYPDLQFTMLDTGIKYLTYFYSAQVKKARQEGTGGDPANLKKTTEELIARYVGLLDYLRMKPPLAALELCAKYYLYEILNRFKTRDQAVQPVYWVRAVYGLGGAQEALLRPLLNDYRYEQTCLALNHEPDEQIYSRYSRI